LQPIIQVQKKKKKRKEKKRKEEIDQKKKRRKIGNEIDYKNQFRTILQDEFQDDMMQSKSLSCIPQN